MTSTEIISAYIKKLSHPLKEIRERSLQLLVAKMQLGWELDDELATTRDLLEALLAWFHVQQPALQYEALDLLLKTIKTKAGTYIAREFGIKRILSTLNSVKTKIDPSALETYNDIQDTLKFLNTVESEENVAIPPLTLQSLISSESDGGSSSGYYNPHLNVHSSKETSFSNEEVGINRSNMSKAEESIKVLLFPWVALCTSDAKTMLLVEDALKLLKSTRRCCRFIRDVFLRDFPAEIFLNRPAIIKSLMTIADGANGGRPGEGLHVLLSITRALRTRLLQLSSVHLAHAATRVQEEQKSPEDRVNKELEMMAGDRAVSPQEDALASLRQLPAPIFALDTLHAVLTTMARSIALVDSVDRSEVLDLKDSNTCLCLVESLVKLLLDCVCPSFWSTEHDSKTHRDIAHKSCMAMRLLGDLMMKYRKSFFEDPARCHHRVAWLRLVSSAETLLSWARDSALPPSTLVLALQAAQLDPALELLYPELSSRIATALMSARTSVDQEFKSKYRELTKLFAGMEEAAKFMNNKDSCRNSKKVLTCIKNSLPVLELHLSETYLNDISMILLKFSRDSDLNDTDWSVVRSIALNLMANNIEWVQTKFYGVLSEMARSAVVSSESNQADNEKCLTILCDVGVLSEICCHGLSSKSKEVETSASEIMLYLLRGRLVLSESCWWRLLASLLPVLPLLHVYAAHDTQLGQAICKSLEPEIAECMGVSLTEVTAGLVRLLFVRCPSVQMDAAHSLCRLCDDDRYLPPRDSLRADVLISALRRISAEDFNLDHSSSPSKTTQTSGLIQILDVLKQDIVLDEHGSEFVTSSSIVPVLEPSLRRSTLQQLSLILRQQNLHEAFVQSDGVKVVMAILRMSMMVDDYLAFPECAISCVAVLNSISFGSRHALGKIPDLPWLLIRVILVFPANESAVLNSAQILALIAWSGFTLQELDSNRQRVPALPLSVTQRTSLPFAANSYWNKSPNSEHSSVEWLLSDEDWRAAIRVRWWCACSNGARVLLGAPPPPAPLALRPTARDLAALRAVCPTYSCTKALLDLENATSHRQVSEALNVLESYTHLVPISSVGGGEFGSLPWKHMRRFLSAPPASSRDAALLITLLQFQLAYIDNIPNEGSTMSWIKSSFIGNDSSVISLLTRDEVYPQQTAQDSIEVTQLQTHIVKVLLRCIILLEKKNSFDCSKMERLVKLLLVCLERVDLKNFHMLGYLNELVRCIRYALNCRHCKLSEDTLVQCLRAVTRTLSGCASGGGRKGQACRLDAMLSSLALLRLIRDEAIPVQRWSEAWHSEVVRAVVHCSAFARAELRAASLHVMAALAYHSHMLPQLLQAIPGESLSQFAAEIFSESHEANAVRAAAAALLTSVTSRASPHTDVLECDVLIQLNENNFMENCLDILVEFCNDKEYKSSIEPNVPMSLLERRAELEVRAQKCGDVHVSPSPIACRGQAPPTAALVEAIADVLYNVSVFPRCPLQMWNERGLYRLLFRCASWPTGAAAAMHRARAASSRALWAAAAHKCVRATLAATKDCLHNLIMTITPMTDDNSTADYVHARTQVFLLLAALLTERSASDSVWRVLRDKHSLPFFHALLQGLESDEIELQDASLYCLTQLAQSTTSNKHSDKTKYTSRVEFFDNLKSPILNDALSERLSAGDMVGCQPEYMAEELCKVLVHHYQKLSMENQFQSSIDERWTRVCSCLCAVLACSKRCRVYGVHRQLQRALLATLQAVRDRLALHAPADVIRSASNNPILRTLYWVLSVINCHMLDCGAAKKCYAADNLAVSLCRLWPWCMLTDQLRLATMHLLLSFSNDCAQACGAMATCVGGRSLAGEACALAAREAQLQARPHADTLLLLCLNTLRHVSAHHHCRAIILKSEVVACMYRVRVRERGASAGALQWARLCEALARRDDGAAALLALRPLACAPPVRARLLPALAHAAAHRRAAVLHSPDLLELLSGTLLAGDSAEVVSAARAVWALAANNHKAKLLLRSAGVAAAVQSAVQRLRRNTTDQASQRALQLLMYTNTVLQTT